MFHVDPLEMERWKDSPIFLVGRYQMKTCIKNPFLLPVLIAGMGLMLAGRVTAQTFTTLHSFPATAFSSEGAGPKGGLVLSGSTLYGTTADGGSSGGGTVFAVNTDGTGFTNVYTFTATSNYTNSDGAQPYAGLILTGKTLYGTARNGGTSGVGTVFKVNTDGTAFKNLHNFTAIDGAQPEAGLIVSGNTLYGTAVGGGSSGNGTVFALNTDGTGFRNLYSFSTVTTNSSLGNYTNSDGAWPRTGLILSGNTLYGTTSYGGALGNGTVFSLSLPVPQLTILPSGSSVILSWLTNYAGFDYSGLTLQSTTNLSSPVWTTNLPPPVVINGQYTITNPISGTQQFFRLSQ